MFQTKVVEKIKTHILCSSVHPSSAEVNNEWSYTSTPPICLHVVDRQLYLFFFFILSLNGVSGTQNSLYAVMHV
jgi:hypothetical protein